MNAEAAFPLEHCLACPPLDEPLPTIVRDWMLRILLRLGAHRYLTNPTDSDPIAILLAMGLHEAADQRAADRNVLPQLRAQAESHRHAPAANALPKVLAGNIDRISRLLGLSGVEERLLAFFVLMGTSDVLSECADLLGAMSPIKVYRTLAVLLDASDTEIRNALAPRSTLARTGLLVFDRDHCIHLTQRFELVSDDFAERLLILDADPRELLRESVSPSCAPTLDMADFGHVRELAGIAHDHLAVSLETGRAGTNILIHGVPGVGKTELARVLASRLGVELFEICSEDSDGDPMTGSRRLRAYRTAQYFFKKSGLLFLFDEAEDAFAGDQWTSESRGSAQRHKAWMNLALETNTVPTLWITNRVDCMDPAFIRRFDVVIELPNPPLDARKDIIRSAVEGLGIGESTVQRISENANVTPAIVSRAANVIRSASTTRAQESTSRALLQLANSTLRAQGHPAMTTRAESALPNFYDPRFINADTNLVELAKRLDPTSSARLLLHGPPGTGKTAYARWLVKSLGIPLHVKRASSLLSPFVGETEMKIATAFEAAEREGAALLVDEIDSFLTDRQGARASWETTMVNEMLVQMESFAGMMIATTNLPTCLDDAAKRRFDFKVSLKPLDNHQAKMLFEHLCGFLRLPPEQVDFGETVNPSLSSTVGDFAVVARQHALGMIATRKDVLTSLRNECVGRRPPKYRIGFT